MGGFSGADRGAKDGAPFFCVHSVQYIFFKAQQPSLHFVLFEHFFFEVDPTKILATPSCLVKVLLPHCVTLLTSP